MDGLLVDVVVIVVVVVVVVVVSSSLFTSITVVVVVVTSMFGIIDWRIIVLDRRRRCVGMGLISHIASRRMLFVVVVGMGLITHIACRRMLFVVVVVVGWMVNNIALDIACFIMTHIFCLATEIVSLANA